MKYKVNRKIFFDEVRQSIFEGEIDTPSQVEGLNRILDYWETWYDSNINRLAYVLATVQWETGKTFQPVKEAYWLSEDWRRRNLRYYPYYGRGDVQLTWEDNYRKMSPIVGVDLVKNPDKALDPSISVKILFEGMYKAETNIGDFTNKSLEEYFNDTKEDPKGARRIVNGTDKDDEIAAIYFPYRDALTKAIYQSPSETETPRKSWIERIIEWLLDAFGISSRT